MNSPEPIGGYFELELRQGGFPYQDAVLLNSARNCFEYVLRARQATHVYLPLYTCDVMLEPLERSSVAYTFYEINADLEIKDDITLNDDELLVYTNYFGVKEDYSRQLSERYGPQLVLDYSQAFYCEAPAGSDTFYSPRKFFGLPDGGCLVTDIRLDTELPASTSYGRFRHLLRRIDEGAEAAYGDFRQDDKSLVGEPLAQMSPLTQRLLGNIDFEEARQARLRNFAFLHERLKSSNKFTIVADDLKGPMAYPYLVEDAGLRQRLIDAKVFVATYWPNVQEWATPDKLEYQLAQQLLPLPVDQRYGTDDMQRILDNII